MKPMTLTTLALAMNAFAAPFGSHLDPRAASTCPVDIDKVFLALIRPIDQATANSFCLTFIQPVVTSTSIVNQETSALVTTTLLPSTSTTTVFATVPSTTTVTSLVAEQPQTIQLTTTISETTYFTETQTTTKTITPAAITQFVKRADSPLPSFVASFQPSQISSACSRIVTPVASTTTITVTSTSVSTSFSTITPDPVVVTVTSNSITLETDVVTQTIPAPVTITNYDSLTAAITSTTTAYVTTTVTLPPAQVTAPICGRGLISGPGQSQSPINGVVYDGPSAVSSVISAANKYASVCFGSVGGSSMVCNSQDQQVGYFYCSCFGGNVAAAGYSTVNGPTNLFGWDKSCMGY